MIRLTRSLGEKFQDHHILSAVKYRGREEPCFPGAPAPPWARFVCGDPVSLQDPVGGGPGGPAPPIVSRSHSSTCWLALSGDPPMLSHSK